MKRLTTGAIIGATLIALSAGLVVAQESPKNPLTEGTTWQELQFDVLGDIPVANGENVFDVEAPYRAHDAATVPLVIRQTDANVKITKATIVIDENPAPVAAEISFGPDMGLLEFETRVRVNQYSNIRVIVDTEEQGKLMNGRFVKASGGCSAPATKDAAAALANIGKIRLKQFTDNQANLVSTPRREAQIMVRHPNYSGLQRNQITQLFIAPHFVNEMQVYQGDDLLFSMSGGISISENPTFRFSYNDNGSTALRVLVKDTEGNTFEQALPKESAI